MMQQRCVTSPVRSPRLLGVAAAVLLVHGLLLYPWHVLPPMPTDAGETNRPGRLQLALSLPDVPQAVRGEVAPLSAQAAMPLPAAPTQGGAVPTSVPKAVVPGRAQAGTPATDTLAAAQSASHDGQTVLDFQLADVRSTGVKLSTLKLSLNVRAGRYEAQMRWTLGATEGTAFSEGATGVGLKPASYRETGKHSVDVAVPAAAQDPLSLLWSLRNLLAALPLQAPDAPAPEWLVPVLIDGTLQTMRWRLVQEDGLTLPGGTLRAAKLVGSLDSDPVTRTNIWYAMDFGYLPVRLERTYANVQVLDAKVSTNVQATFVRSTGPQ